MSNSLNLVKLSVILGPTSSGKTNIAVKLAKKYNTEIISADSRQVYKKMDIGTGKDLSDYGNIKYHMIDVAEPSEQYDLAQYKREAEIAIDEVAGRGKLPLLVGGSGLYLQAIVDNYDLPTTKPDFAAREKLENLSAPELLVKLKNLNPSFAAKLNNSDANNPRRLIRYLEIAANTDVLKINQPKYNCLLIGLNPGEAVLKTRIKQRLLDRLNDQNLVGEVEGLNNDGITWQRLEKFGLEYRWVSRYLQGKIEYEDMVEKLNSDIFKFAKRQLVWFRRWEKQGKQINWVDSLEQAEKLINDFIK